VAGAYRPRHPERTVLNGVLFHYFDRFRILWNSVRVPFFDPMIRPQCGGTMKVIAYLTDYAVVDRIIGCLNPIFVAERPPPPQLAYQELFMAAETSTE
jgi:hypothetical protein